MIQIVQDAISTVSQLNLWSVLDILIVTTMIYGVLMFLRGTTAFSVLYGIVLLLAAVLVVTSIPELVVLNWVLSNSLPILSIAVLILFQPELRRGMERIGRVGIWINRPLGGSLAPGASNPIDEICEATKRLAERRYGALIVLERETGLQEYADTGVPIDGLVTAELLLTLFYPNSPMHDGAVIIRGDRVAAAASVLPLSDSLVDYQLGTRHRAAIGITERTDAISIVVSEETGTISFANNGRMVRHLDEDRLNKILTVLCRSTPYQAIFKWPRRKALAGSKIPKARRG